MSEEMKLKVIDPSIAALLLMLFRALFEYLRTINLKPEDIDAYYDQAKADFDQRNPAELPNV